MNQHQQVGDEAFVRRYEDDDGWTVAADVGTAAGAVDVDVVGETAIVVVETGSGVREAEFELPGEAESVEANNGVLAVRGGTS
ncbi:MAG: Hsp20/alpha crystallin family protein [Haloferacaceae archaeon]